MISGKTPIVMPASTLPYNRATANGATMKFPIGSYDNANIDILQAALGSACEELGISGDTKKCEAVALLIFAYARTGQTDVSKLKAYAIERFECAL
jgi:hypothetical protein